MNLSLNLSLSLGRVWAIATNVFRETVREQVLYLSLLYIAIAVSAMLLLPEFSYDSSAKMIVDVGIAAIEVVSLIVAVLVGTNLINKEIDKRTIFILIAKPMHRAEFVLGKHLGLTAVVGALVSIMTVIFVILMAIKQIPIPIPAILTANFFIFWEIMLLGAIAIFFGSFTGSLIASLLTLGAYLIGNFSRDLLLLGEISKNPSLQAVTRTFYMILPDLSRANLKNDAVYNILPSIMDMFNNGVYILSYALLTLAVTIFIFARRQF
ncbi:MULTISPECIES: ABC transporter permease [unclassified Pseudanabaena]|uniref:ABC transporter permease n=1 Tax=unclassified Pseudanabaena TaxID=2593292 RepID=UPI0006D83830|nr:MULTISPECIES: ABC transporter permease [unclassified Pseudanabaena]TYQ31044.1 ABC transporter permease [Pseudanabaena sp. UWO310]